MGVRGLESAKICESRMECLWRSGARRGQENIFGTEMGGGISGVVSTGQGKEVGEEVGVREAGVPDA